MQRAFSATLLVALFATAIMGNTFVNLDSATGTDARGYTAAYAIDNNTISYSFSSPSLGYSHDTILYNITANNFTETLTYPGAPSTRYAQASCVHPDGLYEFIWGGVDSTGTRLNDAYVFNGTLFVALNAANPPTIATLAACVVTSTNVVYVYGGKIGAPGTQSAQVFKLNLTAETLTWEDVTSTQGTTLNGTTLARQSVAIANAADESGFWVYGGLLGALASGFPQSDYLFYEYASKTWTTFGNVTVNGTIVAGRYDAPYTVANGKLYVFGGAVRTGGTPPTDILVFDLSTQTWTVDNNTFSGSGGNAVAIGDDIYVTNPAKSIWKFTITPTPSESTDTSDTGSTDTSGSTENTANTNTNTDTNTVAPTDDNGSSAFALVPSVALILAAVANLL